VTPSTGTTATTFQFDASGSSDTQDSVSALQVRWDWENDGTWDAPWSATKTASHVYGTTGTKTIKLEVKDSGGLTDDTTRTVSVSSGVNTAPIASFTVEPSSGIVSTVFQFDAAGSSDAEDVILVLQTRWDWENDGIWDTDWSANKIPTHQYDTPGTKVIKMEIKDTGGLTDDTTRTVTVTPDNQAPTASFVVNPSSGTTSTVFHIDASGSWDTEDPIELLHVRWDWENDGTWDTDWSGTKTATHTYATTGTKTIKLEVKDTGGLTDDTTQTFTVISSGPPPGGMVLVPAGAFTMGDGVASCGVAEHEVTLTHGFYLARHEVTNQEYRDAVQWAYDHGHVTATPASVQDNMDGNTAEIVDLDDDDCQITFAGGTFAIVPGKHDCPMVEVSWYGAVAYCDWLSMQAGLARVYDHSTWQCNGGSPYTAVGYRLPTDAEWEYAAQYDDERIFPWGDEPPSCSRANYGGLGEGCVGSTFSVGSYEPAPASLGLYDMAGNVWEWCEDAHICDLDSLAEQDPYREPVLSDDLRVLRGGSWNTNSNPLRCAYREFTNLPFGTLNFVGFRCARTAD
jgi:formylglycine-generating enzyme required for sulfatase activity